MNHATSSATPALSLAQLNAADQATFTALLDGTYEHSPWVAQQAWQRRPFATLSALKQALADAVRHAPQDQQLALIRAHPELAGKAMVSKTLTAESTNEQGKAGLTDCTPEEFARLQQLNADYNARFGFPFILAVRGPRGQGLTRHQIIDTFARRLQNPADFEQAEALRGFDEVSVDAVGNVVGVYHGASPQAPLLMTGSHFDTVRNGGKYDGRLGILVPMACVRELHRAGKRLPFGIEVVGFAEEEGQRYRATFLGSGALIGHFNPAWLEQTDADGVTMRQAMHQAGLPGTMEAIANLQRDASRYLGFVEVHIEQGPVLNEMDLPLGVVTSINGSVRCLVEIQGMASHAGTTPMNRRRDAAAAAAEVILYVERRAASVPDVVGTVGQLEVPAGSINVVPGRCRFSLDLRATTNAARDALAADVEAEIERICARRGLSFQMERTLAVPAAPSHPAWQARWEAAVQALGLPVFRMPSGAGHDAMKLHEVMPQAMLFMRGLNSGISHNPLESITNHDTELVVQAFLHLLEGLAE